ncbi:MAG: diguanylate cyclase [Gammaproteobacteria bacterium]
MLSRPLPRAHLWWLVPLGYFVGARLGVSVAAMPEGIAVLWPPNSVLLVAMLLARPRDVAPIALLGIATEVAADLPTFSPAEALIFGVANALEATLAWALLRRWRFDPRLQSLADLRKFLLAAPLAGALAAALLGAAAYSQFRGGHTGYLDFVRIWWLGDALGLLIFTPLLLSLALPGPAPRSHERAHGRFGRVDAAVVLGGAALTAVLATSRGGLLFGVHLAPALVLPFVVYLAARFDLRAASIAAAVVGLALAWATAHGRHPFGELPAMEATMRVQEFIAAMSLLALGLAALLGQLRAERQALHAANRRLDQLNLELEARVAERTARLDEANGRLEQLAMTDALTGLFNRRAFDAVAHAAVGSARRHHRPLALVMVDIDHFKAINDRHGHAGGDAVLRHVAATLQRLLRGADSLARMGGEEFVVLAPETDLDSALALAHRMGDALRALSVPVPGATQPVTASFGVTALGDPDDLDAMLRRADQALYASKRAGRDRATAVAPGTDTHAQPVAPA